MSQKRGGGAKSEDDNQLRQQQQSSLELAVEKFEVSAGHQESRSCIQDVVGPAAACDWNNGEMLTGDRR